LELQDHKDNLDTKDHKDQKERLDLLLTYTPRPYLDTEKPFNAQLVYVQLEVVVYVLLVIFLLDQTQHLMEMDGLSLVKHQVTAMVMDTEMNLMSMQSAFILPMWTQNLITKYKVLLVHYFI
jgi:hypothetical protein